MPPHQTAAATRMHCMHVIQYLLLLNALHARSMASAVTQMHSMHKTRHLLLPNALHARNITSAATRVHCMHMYLQPECHGHHAHRIFLQLVEFYMQTKRQRHGAHMHVGTGHTKVRHNNSGDVNVCVRRLAKSRTRHAVRLHLHV